MKESRRKGIASHPDPESCVASRKAGREALTGAHAGGISSCEISGSGMPTSSTETEGHTDGSANASFQRVPRSQRPKHAWKLHAREPGDPSNARHDFVSGPVGEGHELEVQHARCWGVGRSYSTDEVPEQKRETVSGGHGGKATDQREHRADDRVPDSELGQRVERLARCARSS